MESAAATFLVLSAFNCRLSLLKIQLKYHTVNWREKLTIVLKHFRKKTTKFYKKYVCSLLAGGWKNEPLINSYKGQCASKKHVILSIQR